MSEHDGGKSEHDGGRSEHDGGRSARGGERGRDREGERQIRPEHQRLRERLREGDPAAERRLPPEAVVAMRERILEEAEAHAGKPSGTFGVPWPRLVAVAATVALVVGLALALEQWRPGPTPPDSPPDPGASGAVTDAATPPAPPSRQAGADAGPGVGSTADASTTSTEPPGAGPARAESAEPTRSASVASTDPRREPRDVRFTAPGGTEIIWTLDPDFEMPGRPRNPGRGEPR